MNKAVALLSAGLMAAVVAQKAQAADLNYQPVIQELVVSGVVESWFGYTVYGDIDLGPRGEDLDNHFSGGRSARLSLPLGSNFSIQMDFDNETNSDYVFSDGDDDAFMYSFQGLTHLSIRDPGTGLIGAFGAVGRGAADGAAYPFYVLGGEAQVYVDNLTFYLQGGYLDSDDATNGDYYSLEDAAFARGVVRYFLTENSRLQGEVSYAAGTVDDGRDGQLVEWAARYDTRLGLPIVGDTNVFVGYRGGYFENEDENYHYMDHTFMVGFRTSFGGNSMIEFDRVGATLDAPNFGRWVGAGNIVD